MPSKSMNDELLNIVFSILPLCIEHWAILRFKSLQWLHTLFISVFPEKEESVQLESQNWLLIKLECRNWTSFRLRLWKTASFILQLFIFPCAQLLSDKSIPLSWLLTTWNSINGVLHKESIINCLSDKLVKNTFYIPTNSILYFEGKSKGRYKQNRFSIFSQIP